MKIISWIARGLGGAARRLIVKDLLRRRKVNIALLQESKINCMYDKIIREKWRNGYVKWECVNSIGAAGCILLLWNNRHISICNSWKDIFSISILVEDSGKNSTWLLTSVY